MAGIAWRIFDSPGHCFARPALSTVNGKEGELQFSSFLPSLRLVVERVVQRSVDRVSQLCSSADIILSVCRFCFMCRFCFFWRSVALRHLKQNIKMTNHKLITFAQLCKAK